MIFFHFHSPFCPVSHARRRAFRGYYDDEPAGPEDEVMEGEEGPEGGVEILDSTPQTGGGAVTERTTTPYMTKYERARILGKWEGRGDG